MDIQKSKLEHGVHILVATPGRLIDLIYHSPLSLSEVRTFVLDEADEMLNMGFITDIEFVISCLVHKHQTLLFSATMPKPIQQLAKKYLKDPLTIELNTDQVAPQNLTHQFKQINRGNHFETLAKFLKEEKPTQAIIFCNSRNNCDKLHQHLKQEKISAETIHGGMEQSKRTSLFNRFKKKKITLMVATDVASRGLDFSHASHVINYDYPRGQEAYTHRTGRTARMGREGTAVTFYTKGDLYDLQKLIKANRIDPEWLGDPPNMDNIKPKKGGGRPYRGKSKGRRPSGKR
jgi:ATP-dependent RNA helicase DeaD